MLGEFLNKILTRGWERYGKFYSCYRGFVLSNEDPDSMKKIMVYVPAITGLSRKGFWAYPKGVATGARWGVNLMPEVGDMVWVEFEYGNPRYPIWSFGYRRKGEAATLYKAEEEENYGFQSPKGNFVNVSDVDGTITAITKTGHKIVLSDGTKNILIKTSAGHEILMDDGLNQIKLETISGQKITLDDANAVITINSGTNGGIPNIIDLAQEINTLKQRINSHQHLASGVLTVVDAITNPFMPLTNPSAIEDPNVTH